MISVIKDVSYNVVSSFPLKKFVMASMRHIGCIRKSIMGRKGNLV
jgi:hypothetical protein